jgi:hypothetical protein
LHARFVKVRLSLLGVQLLQDDEVLFELPSESLASLCIRVKEIILEKLSAKLFDCINEGV